MFSAIAYAIILILSAFSYSLLRRKPLKPLPPGPPRLPIIGNLHQAPTLNPWRTYQQWTKQYGPIFSLQYGLQTVIMLGTWDSAHDLLDKRSAIYSSRPHVVMGGDCVSKGLRTLLMPYGQRWRTHQRLQASYLNVKMSAKYKVVQDMESKQVASDLLSSNDFSSIFHRYSSSLIFTLAYGKRFPRGDESEIKAIDQLMENFLYAARVGTWIVDALPFLNHLPNFMAPWKRLGDRLHSFEADLYMSIMVQGEKSKSWNWVKQAQSMKESKEMNRLELAYDIGILYEAGSDTTTMALETFVMAMVLYPAVMRKAQEELDAVVGSDRLPSFEDKESLPYTSAIVNEVLRWRPVTAGGMPHAVIQDDEYMGYHIPAGATVIGNHWSISLDENVYENPMDFEPERWIKTPDLPLASFGFSRRVCTGQHIAKNSLFINIARILHAFDLGYAYEERDGISCRCDIDPFAMTQGFNSRPMPFKASFTVRSLAHEQTVRREWQRVEKDIDVLLDQVKNS